MRPSFPPRSSRRSLPQSARRRLRPCAALPLRRLLSSTWTKRVFAGLAGCLLRTAGANLSLAGKADRSGRTRKRWPQFVAEGRYTLALIAASRPKADQLRRQLVPAPARRPAAGAGRARGVRGARRASSQEARDDAYESATSATRGRDSSQSGLPTPSRREATCSVERSILTRRRTRLRRSAPRSAPLRLAQGPARAARSNCSPSQATTVFGEEPRWRTPLILVATAVGAYAVAEMLRVLAPYLTAPKAVVVWLLLLVGLPAWALREEGASSTRPLVRTGCSGGLCGDAPRWRRVDGG